MSFVGLLLRALEAHPEQGGEVGDLPPRRGSCWAGCAQIKPRALRKRRARPVRRGARRGRRALGGCGDRGGEALGSVPRFLYSTPVGFSYSSS